VEKNIKRPKTYAKFLLQNLKGRDHLEDANVNGRIILEWILKKYSGNLWTGFIQLRVGISGRPIVNIFVNLWIP
jgi:hypothetical protein